MPATLPFYAKSTIILVGFYVLVQVLFVAQGIVLPFIYAGIAAIAFSPAVRFLVAKKWGRASAVFLVLAIVTLVILAFLVLIGAQGSRLSAAWPTLSAKFLELLNAAVGWVSSSFDIPASKINAWLADFKSDLLEKSGSAIGLTLSTMGGVLATAVLTPVYVFMLLFYQPRLIEFTHRVCGTGQEGKVSEILTETKTIIQSYIVGLFAEFAIVAALNSLGLLALGIEYALLLGVFAAALNIVPYLGGLVAMFLIMLVALVTKSPIYMLYVGVLYLIIQLIDNNYIVPKIIGSKVRLNALVSLLAVILGAALWGIPGMFLSIPLVAVLKLLLDRIESLKPWGFLLGDEEAAIFKIPSRISRKKQA